MHIVFHSGLVPVVSISEWPAHGGGGLPLCTLEGVGTESQGPGWWSTALPY